MSETKEWTDNYVLTFLQILYERVKNHPNNSPSFNDADWTKIDNEMKVLVGISYGVEKLKSKYHRLRGSYRQFTELINHTGVTWDVDANKVHAPEEIWQKLAEKNKGFKTFRRNGCKNYELLAHIFSPSTATDKFAFSSTQRPPTSDEKRLMNEEYFNGIDHEEIRDEELELTKHSSEDGPRRRNNSSLSKSAKIDEALDMLASTLSSREQLTKAKLEKMERKKNKKSMMEERSSAFEEQQYTIDEVMNVLNDMPHLSPMQYTIAVERTDQFNWRKKFLQMVPTRRLDYLQSLELQGLT
ncbi:hypothetical protein ACFE04_019865 [Oxalis oulophora]